MTHPLNPFHPLSKCRWHIVGFAALVALFVASFLILRANEDEAWARIQQRGLITFATDPTYPPFEALDANGNFFGFDIDLARAVAERLGLKAEFEAVSYDGLIGTLVVGRDDAVISAWVIQPERGKEASFTPSYFNAGVVLVTRADVSVTRDDISRYKWQAGKTLAAEYGSQGDALIRKWSRLVAGLTPISSPDSAAAMQAVKDGQAEGALVDAVAAFEFLGAHAELKVAAFIPESDASYVIAVSAKSQVLLRELTRVLNELEADGSLGELRVKWFGEAAR
ncbi:MAG: amino acid ABC transporter substrate-binding protein [Chloroflexi bacterium]|nr:amino acid ABC transporter substrate-binding protein [Chloroflexota bacterium]